MLTKSRRSQSSIHPLWWHLQSFLWKSQQNEFRLLEVSDKSISGQQVENDTSLIYEKSLVKGKIDEFDSQDSLGCSSLFQSATDFTKWRCMLFFRLAETLPSPEQEMVVGLLFTQQQIPQPLRSLLFELRATFLFHPTAYTALILSEAVFPLWVILLPKRFSGVLFSLLLLFFQTISGFSRAISRVAIFAFLQWVGFFHCRQGHSLLLFVWSFVLLWLTDRQSLFELSFQLSFLSGLGIRLFLPLFLGKGTKPHMLFVLSQANDSPFLRLRRSFWGWLQSLLVLFFSAQVFTLPRVLLLFPDLSCRNVIFSLLSFAWMQVLVPLSLFLEVWAVLSLPGLVLLGKVAYGPFWLFTRCIFWVSSLPDFQIQTQLHWAGVISWWLVVFLCFFAVKHLALRRQA